MFGQKHPQKTLQKIEKSVGNIAEFITNFVRAIPKEKMSSWGKSAEHSAFLINRIKICFLTKDDVLSQLANSSPD